MKMTNEPSKLKEIASFLRFLEGGDFRLFFSSFCTVAAAAFD
jgi:hypothetical protein